jgi:hypothetical protein
MKSEDDKTFNLNLYFDDEGGHRVANPGRDSTVGGHFSEDQWFLNAYGVFQNGGKMTKSFIMSIPEGLFLVSGIVGSPWEPMVEEVVGAPQRREELWQRIRLSRADQRNCFIFKSEADHKKTRSGSMKDHPRH